MNTAVAIPVDPMADFQAKLKERVRNDIRDLLPEDAVAALVAQAVKDEFFKPRMEKEHGGWNARDIQRPSWFMEEVVKAAQPIIKDAVAKCLVEQHAEVEKAIRVFLDANQLTLATTNALTGMLGTLIMDMSQQLREIRNR